MLDQITEVNGEIKMPLQKDKFAFPKQRRFSPPKITNHQISYTPLLSDFERVRAASISGKPTIPGMGGSSSRFDYYSSRRKHGTLPSA